MRYLFVILVALAAMGCQPENYENTYCYWTVALDRVCVERQPERLNPVKVMKPERVDNYYLTADDMAYLMRDHFERGGTHTEVVQLFIDTLEHYDRAP